MSLCSTKDANYHTTWREGILQGLAPDGGLFLPKHFPHIGEDKLRKLRGSTFPELAEEVLTSFLGEEVSVAELSAICRESFNFPLHLISLSPKISVLELFHGPTCAFKDFGARFMARLFRYFLGQSASTLAASTLTPSTLTVLTATSGDTGSAVANAFFDPSAKPAIKVMVLFPKGKVSPIQERQMTTLGQEHSRR
jgi:threonine synthase